MHELIQELIAAHASGRESACCRLVETRGSTPQKAGAMMIVFADGSQAGTLGGGCVEAEVKRRALAVLTQEQAEISCFQLDSDYGWDDGLICGGRMQVLIEPSNHPATMAYFTQVEAILATGSGCTEAIVFDAEASGLAAPATYLFDENDRFVMQLRGETARGDAPSAVLAQLKPLVSRPRPYAAHGMAFLTSLPRCRLVIVGGGHVGKAVAELAADLDFDVWVVDDRTDIVSEARFPRAERRISGEIGPVLQSLEITPSTYCLIVTRGHNHDEESLYHLANRGEAYVGMIGSKRKIKLIFDDLLNEGTPQAVLDQVHAPVGLEIGSQTVPEIAISIAADSLRIAMAAIRKQIAALANQTNSSITAP